MTSVSGKSPSSVIGVTGNTKESYFAISPDVFHTGANPSSSFQSTHRNSWLAVDSIGKAALHHVVIRSDLSFLADLLAVAFTVTKPESLLISSPTLTSAIDFIYPSARNTRLLRDKHRWAALIVRPTPTPVS